MKLKRKKLSTLKRKVELLRKELRRFIDATYQSGNPMTELETEVKVWTKK